jgi:hypothetical protein
MAVSDTTLYPSSGSESDNELSYPERPAPDTDEASDVQPTTRNVPQIPHGICVMLLRPQPPRTSSQTETEQQDIFLDSTYSTKLNSVRGDGEPSTLVIVLIHVSLSGVSKEAFNPTSCWSI